MSRKPLIPYNLAPVDVGFFEHPTQGTVQLYGILGDDLPARIIQTPWFTDACDGDPSAYFAITVAIDRVWGEDMLFSDHYPVFQ